MEQEVWAGKSWANGDELVILASPCPAFRNSLDLCALVSTRVILLYRSRWDSGTR